MRLGAFCYIYFYGDKTNCDYFKNSPWGNVVLGLFIRIFEYYIPAFLIIYIFKPEREKKLKISSNLEIDAYC